MDAALVGNNFSPIPSKISFHIVVARYLQSIKSYLTHEPSQYPSRKSEGTLSSNEPVAARRDCCLLGNALCLCSPVRPAHAVPERGPKSSAIDFSVKNFDYLME